MLGRREVALGLMGGLAVGAAAQARSKPAPLAVGDPAPDFRVTTFELQTYDLADLRGQVVVLNYWATWCAPCRAEMVVMDTYIRAHPAKAKAKDLRIFAITVDESAPVAKLRPLAQALAFPLAKRLKGKGYGQINNQVPTSFVIDRAGVIRHAEAGAFTDASFARLVTPLLAEAPPPPVAAAAVV